MRNKDEAPPDPFAAKIKSLQVELDRLSKETFKEQDGEYPREPLLNWVRVYEGEYLPLLSAQNPTFGAHPLFDLSDRSLAMTYTAVLRELLRGELPLGPMGWGQEIGRRGREIRKGSSN